MLVLEEEVDAQIGLVDHSVVLDGEVADAGENQVLQRLETNDTWSRVQEEYVRVLEGHLAHGAPQTQLAIIPGEVVSSWAGGGETRVRTHFFSFAVGPCTGGGRSAMLVYVEKKWA